MNCGVVIEFVSHNSIGLRTALRRNDKNVRKFQIRGWDAVAILVKSIPVKFTDIIDFLLCREILVFIFLCFLSEITL